MSGTDSALDLEHPSTEPKPLARVYGEPVNELPQDLYIPPEALEVFLETFEGPLDPLVRLETYGLRRPSGVSEAVDRPGDRGLNRRGTMDSGLDD